MEGRGQQWGWGKERKQWGQRGKWGRGGTMIWKASTERLPVDSSSSAIRLLDPSTPSLLCQILSHLRIFSLAVPSAWKVLPPIFSWLVCSYHSGLSSLFLWTSCKVLPHTYASFIHSWFYSRLASWWPKMILFYMWVVCFLLQKGHSWGQGLPQTSEQYLGIPAAFLNSYLLNGWDIWWPHPPGNSSD